MAEVKAKTIKDYLRRIGEPFRKVEEEDKEEEQGDAIKLEDLTPNKKPAKGLKAAADSFRKAIGK